MSTGFTTEAVVLAATDVGEEDRILTFLTRDRGLMRAAASGARNLAKGRSAPLDLFVRTRLHVNHPRRGGGLKRISSAEVIEPFLGIRADYDRLCAASYMAQTTAHCIQEEDPSSGVCDMLLFCLHQLDSGVRPFRVLLAFEVRILKEVGILPELMYCLGCAKQVNGDGFLDAREGGVLHRECGGTGSPGRLSAGDLATLRFMTSRNLAALGKLTLNDSEARSLFDIVHTFSVHHLAFESKALKMIKN